jgi:hypothetical protein
MTEQDVTESVVEQVALAWLEQCLRDTLLQELISGDLPLSYVERFIGGIRHDA